MTNDSTGPHAPVGWETRTLSELLIGGPRNGVYKPKEFHGRGVKIVNMGELFGNGRLRSIPMKRIQLTETELDRSSLRANDLLFARRSLVAEGAGKCSIVLDVDEPTTFESSIIRLRPDPSKANSLFLYYLFNSPMGLNLLASIRRQVAVAGITGRDLANLRLPVPALPVQSRIANALGSLDELIETNHEIARTSHRLLRALYDDKFEKTDQSGDVSRHRTDISSTIGEVTTVVGGSTPSTKNPEYWESGQNAFCTPKDMASLIAPVLLDTGRHITAMGVETISSKALPADTVLLSSRAPIGYLAVARTQVSINQGIIAIPPGRYPSAYLLVWLEKNMPAIEARAGGSTFAEINKKSFRGIPFVPPDGESLAQYAAAATPQLDLMTQQLTEAQSLSALRDHLLSRFNELGTSEPSPGAS